MADKAISQLTEITSLAVGDLHPVVDVSDPTQSPNGTIKKITDANLKDTLGINTNTTNIATNTADIATNTADIATNTADIATNTADIATMSVATGAEVNTGTDNAKRVTPKAIADSNVSFPTKTETLTNKTLTTPVINQPTLNVNPSHGTAVFAADVTGSDPLVIADNGVATPFSNTNNFSGLLLITNITTGITACFLIGQEFPVLLGQTNGSSEFTITKDTGNNTNIYYEAPALKIQNTLGASCSYYIMAFRTRVGL